MGRISEAWSSLTSPGVVVCFGLPFDLLLLFRLKSKLPVEPEPRLFALWSSIPQMRLVQNVCQDERCRAHEI
jgi:hypothetical protein